MPKRILTYHLKNFNHSCCKKWLEHCLTSKNIKIISVQAGSVTLESENKNSSEDVIKEAGFVIIEDKNLIKVEAIKQAVYEIVFLQNHQNSIINKSEYLIEKMGMTYPSISKIFSRYNDITLEKYIIKQKIEKIKDLIDSEDYTLSEIAYIMDYSSVQHLSNQFKKETGYSFTEYSQLDRN